MEGWTWWPFCTASQDGITCPTLGLRCTWERSSNHIHHQGFCWKKEIAGDKSPQVCRHQQGPAILRWLLACTQTCWQQSREPQCQSINVGSLCFQFPLEFAKRKRGNNPTKSELNLCKPEGSGCGVQAYLGLGDPDCFTGWVLCQWGQSQHLKLRQMKRNG